MKLYSVLIIFIFSIIIGTAAVAAEDFSDGSSTAFEAVAESGSSVMGTQIGSLITDASVRDIGATADFPPEFSYSIDAKNVLGSVNAFINVHGQSGWGTDGVLAGDFAYAESDTATGFVSSFVKTMTFQA